MSDFERRFTEVCFDHLEVTIRQQTHNKNTQQLQEQ